MIIKLIAFLRRRLGERQGAKRLLFEIITVLKQGGVTKLVSEIAIVTRKEPMLYYGNFAYQHWMKQHDYDQSTDETTLVKELSRATQLPQFLVLVFNNQKSMISAYDLEQSFSEQLYKGFETDLVSTRDVATGIKNSIAQKGYDYLIFMIGGDRLSANALAMLALAAEEYGRPPLLYSDHDIITADGKRSDPNFKPDWNEVLFYSNGYVNRAFAIRRDIVEACLPGGSSYNTAILFDLFLRAFSKMSDEKPVHLPRVLFHLTAEDSPFGQSVEDRTTVLQTWFAEQELDATAKVGNHHNVHIIYHLPETLPTVSVIIPTRDRASLLETAIMGLLHSTDYLNLEIIVVDNDSVETETLALFDRYSANENFIVASHPGPFNFSSMINLGAREATGDILCLLNNDIEVLSPDWLREMVSWSMQKNVGAVGAKLIYPDRRIQHAGVVMGMRDVAGHIFKFLFDDEPGYQGRLQAAQEYSAVTAACLVVRKQLFDKVGGFNAEYLPVAFNDVDFCLKLMSAGYRNIYTPDACLMHHESISRGKDIDKSAQQRAKSERSYLADKWHNYIEFDPCFPRNLSRESDDWEFKP